MGPRLDEQLFVYQDAAQTVVVTQRWSGFLRTRCVVAVSANGRLMSFRVGTAAEASTWFESKKARAANRVDEATARLLLRQVAGVGPVTCACGRVLPIAAPWCPGCGADQPDFQTPAGRDGAGGVS